VVQHLYDRSISIAIRVAQGRDSVAPGWHKEYGLSLNVHNKSTQYLILTNL